MLTGRSILLTASIAAFTVFGCATAAFAQSPDPKLRQQAIDVYELNNFVAALPLLEKAAEAYPNDLVILSRLGFALYANSTDEKDPATRQKVRDRARSILLKSQSLGDDSNLTRMALDTLSNPDASQIPFSNIRTAEAAIREGESAFTRGDMDKAIAAYKRALDADPNLYDAALYAGDAEYKNAMNSTDARYRAEHFAATEQWFAKAVAIDPDRETAYRYWGDALDAQGKTNEARDKFVDAIVAQPYTRNSFVGFTQWADRHKVQLAHPKIDIPSNVNSNKPGEINITIDELTLKGNDDGSAAWMMYGIVRAGWMNKKDGSRSDKFASAYPNETSYRHTLAEEADALRMVAESVRTQIKEKHVKKLTSSLDNLMRLTDAGLLEPYILFVRADQGIARDYATYRKDNRDKLRRYWLEVAIVQQ